MEEVIELTLVKYARVVDHFIYEHLTGTPESLYQAALHLVKAVVRGLDRP